MALDETNAVTNGGTGWGVIIFFLIMFWIFTGGFNRPNPQGNVANLAEIAMLSKGNGQVTNCELERRSLLNTDAITAAVQNSTNELALQSRRQYDAMQGEKMFDLKLNALSQQQRYETQAALSAQNYESKLAAKDATIERMTLAQNMTCQFNALAQKIANIEANMLVKPNVTGVGAVCPNAGIINGLGIGSSLGGCYGAGTIM